MDYRRPVRKSPSLHGRKSTPNPKFLGTVKAYFVCHIGIFLWFIWLAGHSLECSVFYGLCQRWWNTGLLFGLFKSSLPLYFTISDIVHRRELWASKFTSFDSNKSLEICGCKRWCPNYLQVCGPAAPVLNQCIPWLSISSKVANMNPYLKLEIQVFLKR